ncbi:MAG: penicillin-binding transpeptidase domain-containing protein [Candidatus Promineifilaceae bacterium]|jgi:peptidoglycan glycosyltransferase
MNEIPPITPDREAILNLAKVLLGAFLLVGASLLFWGVVRSGALLARDDNPRRLEAEARIQRGSILDSQERVLAISEESGDRRIRVYPLPAAGHLVGYYSILHGTSGAEAGFDEILRGDSPGYWAEWLRGILHEPQAGRDVKLALDYAAQETAVEALSGSHGGALLLEIPRDGTNHALVRAMASLPGFDANELDAQFEELGQSAVAPLLNRVTQGQYQPGLLLQPLILASSIDQGIVSLSDTVEDPNRPVTINGTDLRCISPPPDPATWADVLLYRCPAPMQDLAERLGTAGLDRAFSNFGLDRDPVLEIDTRTPGDQHLQDPRTAAIGQENLSVTPLQVGLAMAALAGSGMLPQAQTGEAIAVVGGEWDSWTLEGPLTRAVDAAAARAVRRALPQENGIYEFDPVVLSGPQGSRNAWYVGILPGQGADYVAVVVLENENAPEAAQAAGRALLQR